MVRMRVIARVENVSSFIASSSVKLIFNLKRGRGEIRDSSRSLASEAILLSLNDVVTPLVQGLATLDFLREVTDFRFITDIFHCLFGVFLLEPLHILLTLLLLALLPLIKLLLPTCAPFLRWGHDLRQNQRISALLLLGERCRGSPVTVCCACVLGSLTFFGGFAELLFTLTVLA